MFFLLAHICFRVTTPEKLQSLSIKNNNFEYQECLRLSKDKSIKNIDHMVRFKRIKEEEEDDEGIVFEDTTFSSKSFDQYTFYSEDVNLGIKNCTFNQCTFQNSLIYSNNDGYNFTMTLTTINGCYNKNQAISSTSTVVISKSSFTTIQNNIISFTDIEHSCRAYMIQKTTNTIFTDNQVTNANVGSLHDDIGSGLLFNEGGNGLPLEFAGNTFSSCYGGNGAILVVRDVFYHLQIRNTTFEKSKNNQLINSKNEPSGYYINIGPRDNTPKPELSFIDCTFNYLESNAKGGGSIGLWFKENINMIMWLNFENTKFTYLYFADTKQPGGALLFYYQATNRNTYLTVTDCTFDNITSAKDGAAIYFESVYTLTVERCTFTNAVPRKQGSTIAAVYVNFYEASTTATFSDCTFENSERLSSQSAYQILLKSSASSSPMNKVIIDKCTFNECRYNSYVISSKVYELNFINSYISSPSCGGITIFPVTKFVIQNSQFINTETNMALSITQNTFIDDESVISNCIFDGCRANENSVCFDLNLFTSSLIFSNNEIRNIDIDSGKYYLGSINCKNRIETLEMRNITFDQNQCGPLYGGGSGLFIQGISKISYIDCKFNGNVARQYVDQTRPIAATDNGFEYLAGDGGAIQIGYSSLTSEVDVLFDNCIFQKNKAFRHGGAIAIQTLKTVEILRCQFLENEADIDDNYPSVLYVNHYNKKEEGRGGAIYINPCFTYFDSEKGSNYPADGVLMTNIKIDGCTFTKNKAYDGHAIYVEGDETASTVFVITNNNFNNNYNSQTYTENSAVIVSEITNIYDDDEKTDTNTFNYDSGVTDIPNKIMYVDHYGKAPSYSFIYGSNLEQTSGNWIVTSKHYITSDGNEASAQLKFIGIGFNVYGSCEGDMEIYLDGKEINIVFFGGDKEDSLLYTSPEFEFGEHVITIKASSFGTVTIAKIATTTYYQPQFADFNLFDGSNSWEQQDNNQGGHRLYTNVAQRTLVSTITCSQFYIFGQRGPNYGKMQIRVDMKDFGTVETKSDKIENFALLYTSDKLDDASHQIQIIVESGPVYLDYMSYTDSDIYLFENHTAFSYDGDWTESNTGHLTSSADSTLEFVYFGTAFKIFGSKGHDFGRMKIMFDGNEVAEVDTKFEYEPRHTLLFDSADNGVNAVSGQHSIKITPAENNQKIEVCRITYLQPVVAPTPSASITPAATDIITETPTEEITETATKVITETATKVITESPTKVITETATKVITESPTKEIAETATKVITESPTKEIAETATKVITESPTKVIPETATKVITESATKEIVQTYTQPPTAPVIYPEDIFNDANCNKDNRCKLEVDDDRVLNVYIDKTLFEDYTQNEYGGAIYLIKCGIKCNKTQFTHCTATNGGGAIFIRNDLEKQNSITIENIFFTRCSASFGGAIYIYTNTKQVPVRITNCQFKLNTIVESGNAEETNNGLIGGMSIFLTSRNAKVVGCTFEDDPECEHGSLKFYNNYNAKPNSHSLIGLSIGEYENKVLVSDCKFTINKNERNSIHYVRGMNGVEFDVQNCIFNGVLSENAHFIEEAVIFKDSPKLRIKDCKFSDDSKKSFLLDSTNDIQKINLQNKFSIHNSSEGENGDDNNNNNVRYQTLKIVLSIVLPTLAVVAIVAISLVVLMKKNEIDLLHDSDESNEQIDL